MTNPLLNPLRMALIGGGGAGFIGKVHATAATLDRHANLVAGALSSNPQKSKASAGELGIDPSRAYGSWQELLDQEAKRDENDRVQFVSIATPNHTHCEIALAALQAGMHVVCDKPMTTNLQDAEKMVDAVNSSGRVFALTHNYSGYPLMRQAREMVAGGELGELIAVRATYVQGWMHGMDPQETPDRGAWKSDPDKNGRAGSLGDVGTHAFHLTRFVTGLMPQSILSEMKSYSPHHQLDDYGHALVRFDQGATGIVTWSQVSHGRLNDLSIEIEGTKAALSWRQENPNEMWFRRHGKAAQLLERDPGAEYATPTAAAACRLPAGHPEAFFEAFANVYRNALADMHRVNEGQSPQADSLYPKVEDGLEGVRFMTRCLESADEQSAWRPW